MLLHVIAPAIGVNRTVHSHARVYVQKLVEKVVDGSVFGL
jgi:hypothetical protein